LFTADSGNEESREASNEPRLFPRENMGGVIIKQMNPLTISSTVPMITHYRSLFY